jgi:hypothetical protein
MSPIWQGKNETVLYIIELLQLSPQSGSLERALPRTALQSRDHLSSKEARCILKSCLSSCLVDLLAWSIFLPGRSDRRWQGGMACPQRRSARTSMMNFHDLPEGSLVPFRSILRAAAIRASVDMD